MDNNSDQGFKILQKDEKLNKDLDELLADNGMKLIDGEKEIDFKCNHCGHCCTGTSINLNPYDTYNMAKFKNLTVYDFIEKYCTISIGQNSHLPIVRIRNNESKLCPFLSLNTKTLESHCELGENKPGSCKMSPIGIVRTLNATTGETEYKYALTPLCPNHGTGNPVKVKDLAADYVKDIDLHNMGSTLTVEILKYIDMDVIYKTFVEKDEAYIESKGINKSILKFADTTIQKIMTMFLSSYIQNTFEFDITKSFKDQYQDRVNNIQVAAVEMSCSVMPLGIKCLRNGTDGMCSEALVRMDELLKNMKEVFGKDDDNVTD